MRNLGDLSNPNFAYGKVVGDAIYGWPNRMFSGDLDTISGGTAFNPWSTANLAIYCLGMVPVPITITKMGYINGNATAGNIDMGIYDLAGNRLVSSGSTPHSGSGGTVTTVTVASTYLPPGLYYFAMAADSTTPSLTMRTGSVVLCRMMGFKVQSTAFTLPATATFATATAVLYPRIFAWEQ